MKIKKTQKKPKNPNDRRGGVKGRILRLAPTEIRMAELLMTGMSAPDAYFETVGKEKGKTRDSYKTDYVATAYYYARKVHPYLQKMEKLTIERSRNSSIAKLEEVLWEMSMLLREDKPHFKVQAAKLLQNHYDRVADRQALSDANADSGAGQQVVVILPEQNADGN